jgi:hypothetical protein
MVLTLIEKEVEFDDNPYLFAFNNVVWDLKEGKIIPSSPNQMISLTTGYDYNLNMTDLEVKKKTLMDILKEIFPDESVRNYDLIVRSSGLVGIQVQNLIVSNGVGGNGKTILNELMISSVGNYGYVLSSTCLTQEIKTGANPELANLHNKRKSARMYFGLASPHRAEIEIVKDKKTNEIYSYNYDTMLIDLNSSYCDQYLLILVSISGRSILSSDLCFQPILFF